MDSKIYFKNMMSNASDYDRLKVYDNVRDLFVSTSLNNLKEKAITWSSGSKLYSELLEDVLKLSYIFKNKAKKGDNVGLLFNNEYDFVRSFFACSLLGYVCVLIPGAMPEEKVKGLFNYFDLKFLISNKNIGNEDEQYFNINNLSIENYWDVEQARSFVKIDPKDAACIVFTGGTTGMPKGAVLSQRNLCRGAFNGSLVKGKVFGIKYLSLIPFTHIFGLVKNLLSCILSASELYIVTNPSLFAKEAMIYQPEVLVLTPGLCSLVLTLLKNYGPNFFGPKFKTIIAGGAHVPSSLIEAFKKFDIECLPGYGLTEVANLISGNGSIDTKNESVGVAYPEQELKIVNNELWVKGDNVFLGYYKNEAANKACFEDGFLKTGDLARFDKDGFLYIDGRVNNLIVLSSGLKVCPENIEELIGKNELVRDSIVSKNQDNDFLTVEILLFENSTINQDNVKKYIFEIVNPSLESAQRITNISFRNEDFKRTPAMKIIR